MSDVLTKPIIIDLVADVVCPYCYLGWGRLKAAIAARPGLETHVNWRPFQLNPDMPAEGVDTKQHMARIIPDPARLKMAHDNLAQQGAALGLDFQFDKIQREPNTSGAHRLILWALQAGKQNAAVEALFRAHFTEGRFIADPEVLADIGAEIGLDRALVAAKLAAGAEVDFVRDAHAMAVRTGITGVPCTIFNSRFALMGAEAPERYLQALDQAAAEA